ncbi:hypothetical protein OHS71_38735 [Streptomyces sp. NBC_00377]|uniref:hypothetical protein n=1 Tax=unclassified Streptomyces TaxID=2593676 RepID=UPI002E23CED5|nr:MULTISPECIES: hypothetical protein [unclassified Streptomyces]
MGLIPGRRGPDLRSAVDKAGLALTVDCPALSRPVHVDRDMWEKVILNRGLSAGADDYADDYLVKPFSGLTRLVTVRPPRPDDGPVTP